MPVSTQSIITTPAASYSSAIWGIKTIKVASINISTSGDNTIISAETGKRHYILKLVIIAEGAVDIILKHGATAWTGPMKFADLTGLTLDLDNCPLITGENEAFIINLSAAVTVTGFVMYFTE